MKEDKDYLEVKIIKHFSERKKIIRREVPKKTFRAVSIQKEKKRKYLLFDNDISSIHNTNTTLQYNNNKKKTTEILIQKMLNKYQIPSTEICNTTIPTQFNK
jgi:late competence protein required for DNA uptake (superfamily II DNA/RNA helicase)